MKISVWSNYFNECDPYEATKLFYKHSFRYGEFADEHGSYLLNNKIDPQSFKDFLDDLDFKYTQGHLKLNADICAINRAQEIQELKVWIDLYYSIGIKKAVIHPGGDRVNNNLVLKSDEELLDLRVKALKELCEYIGDRDFTLCLENLFEEYDSKIYPQVVTYEDFVPILNGVNSDKLAICFDTGHYNLFKKDHDNFIYSANSKLQALHIADNEGYSDMHLMPFERGTINWEKVIKALKDIGYDGLFNLEIPGESRCPLDIKEMKLDYIYKLTNYMVNDL